MLRIHFTVEDLARVRMVASLGPVAESIFALDLLGQNSGAVFNRWGKRVRERVGARGGAVERLVRDRPPLSELLWLLEWAQEAHGAARADGRHQERMAAVFEFCQASVIPHWERLRDHLESVRDVRGRVAIGTGVEGLLGTLHPKTHWNPPVLEIPGEADRDIHLRGRGLLLSPSLFLFSRTCVFVDQERETHLPTLVFSLPVDPATTSELLDVGEPKKRALGDLVGHTRAAALQVLTDSCTTGELSERLGISLAGASKHAKVLRRAGLITTERNRNTALHTLTSLGLALLQSRKPSPERQQREVVRRLSAKSA